jgi:hypothetical protein
MESLNIADPGKVQRLIEVSLPVDLLSSFSWSNIADLLALIGFAFSCHHQCIGCVIGPNLLERSVLSHETPESEIVNLGVLVASFSPYAISSWHPSPSYQGQRAARHFDIGVPISIQGLLPVSSMRSC